MADSEEAIRNLEMELAMSQEKHRTCTQEVQHAQQRFILTRQKQVRIKFRHFEESATWRKMKRKSESKSYS